MTAPLTPAELAELERDVTETHRMPPHFGHVKRLIAEVRASRELLATPMPCGWPVPKLAMFHDDGCTRAGVSWEAIDVDDAEPLDPDEAEALGVALLRVAARARAGRGVGDE